MTVYRVGPQGATVFDADGEPMLRLRPGQVVVPGTIDTADSLASRHLAEERKRLRGYEDKRMAPDADTGLS